MFAFLILFLGYYSSLYCNSLLNPIIIKLGFFLGIPHLVFLTKIDKICKLVEEDVSKTYKSSNVEDAIDKAAKIIAIPRSQILPVKNYEKETILNMDINILALTALKKSLVFADDILENQYYWQEDNVQILNKRD